MKGIILAGGKGTRLYPMTKVISKQLLPIYDKPMIYYPLSVLMLAGIKEILLITSPSDIHQYRALLGTGEELGISIEYVIQQYPNGIAESFILGEDFIGNESVCLILGDNIFFGQDLVRELQKSSEIIEGAKIFGYPVKDPSSFGVVEFDSEYNVVSIEEKPLIPKSNYAVPGLYFYDNEVIKIAKSVRKSERGELEITSINNRYLELGKLVVVPLSRGIAWLDTGTPEGMLKAAEYVETIQSRQGLYIACLEEIAWRKKFISDELFRNLGQKLAMTDYGKYILTLLNES
ncbi:glucose-1-phosphate thymidylyltransferase RfbA [Fusibacter bizertensis]|uniref:Glucose-1-phosphate thymidylyltransferase n=1 Tax=Fusibacter bizertensis TaxID=1488331 RepID=A0ABT6NDW6_9FIRM|nr:glucose-1-phosphate thymidylyltransferase RfbA [Fusibacter bizertensis]MDH8678598.1 glucose-1-phosphate thymidylyltransferase RfbA [Fusibacter bizertensis]